MSEDKIERYIDEVNNLRVYEEYDIYITPQYLIDEYNADKELKLKIANVLLEIVRYENDL